jgi:4-hydroxy-tetrahydrodipicolinate synthase
LVPDSVGPAEPQSVPTTTCFVVSITPFAADGSIDEDGLRRHLGRMANAGIGVYVGGGGSGEGYTLTDREVRQVQDIAVEELKGRVPVRAMGVEPRTATEMVRFVAGAESAGVDAVQVYSLDVGHGHRPSPIELEGYFDQVFSSTTVPCVLSTHQSVGYQVPIDVIAGLAARFPHMSGVNCSHQDLAYLVALVDALPGHAVHVGGPTQALTALALGARGFLSSEANLAPRLAQAVGVAATREPAFATLLRLSLLLYGHGGIRATKALLDRLGLPGGVPRPPRLPLDDPAADQLLRAVTSIGVLDWEGLRAPG